jgi:hypothetical protein
MEIAIIIQILVTVAEVLKEVWDGPLGQLIRDLAEGKVGGASIEQGKELDKIIEKKKSECKVTAKTLMRVIYLFTLARITNPKKYKAACKVREIIIDQASRN